MARGHASNTGIPVGISACLLGKLGEHPRVVGTADPERDVTDDLDRVGERFIAAHRHLRGFILMKGSPSCGLERVKVYHFNGMPSHADSGAFVHALKRHFPELPLEEEARLNDPELYHPGLRLRRLEAPGGGRAELPRPAAVP